MENNVIISAESIIKKYSRGSEDIFALNRVSIEIRKGEFVSFTGPSGSGKTTLVNILGCLDNPTSGKLTVSGRTIFADDAALSESKLTLIRRELFGYIFQSFYLIPTLTVYENTVLPHTFYKKETSGRTAEELLEMLGLRPRMNHLPSQLSGGEMQRVSIARALVNSPHILFADEPTGNLDNKRSREIGLLLKKLNEKEGITILMVTHNLELAGISGRQVSLKDGRIIQ